MSSKDLRPLSKGAAMKSRSMSRSSASSLPDTLFKVGDKVLAKWFDQKGYAAKILEVLEGDMYRVVFFDGFQKEVRGKTLRPLPKDMAKVKFSKEPVLAPHLPSLFAEPESEALDKESRREKSRKLVLSEVFVSRRRSFANTDAESPAEAHTPNKGNARLVKTISDPPEKSEKKERSRGKSEGTSPASPKPRSKHSSGSSLMSGESIESISDVPHHRSRTRRSGRVIGGRALTSRSKSIGNGDSENMSLVQDDPDNVNDASTITDANLASSSPNEAKKRSYPEDEQEESRSPSLNTDTGIGERVGETIKLMELAADPVHLSVILPIPQQEAQRGSGDIVKRRRAAPLPSMQEMEDALTDHNPFQCPKAGCSKGFRKENLLQMHIKHYHPEYEHIVHAPSVIDLALNRGGSGIPLEGSPSYLKKIARLEAKKAQLISAPTDIPQPVTTSITVLPESAPLMGEEERTVSIVKIEGSEASASPKGFPIERREKAEGKDEEKKVPIKENEEGGEGQQEIQEEERLEDVWNYDIIMCSCGNNADDGLMVQCERCTTWQHGACVGYKTSGQVPEEYLCPRCCNPLHQRHSTKYWTPHEELVKFPLPEPSAPEEERERLNEKWKRSRELVSALLSLDPLLRSLRHKITVASKEDHPKLVHWAKQWEEKENSSSSGNGHAMLDGDLEGELDPSKLSMEELTKIASDLISMGLEGMKSEDDEEDVDLSALLPTDPTPPDPSQMIELPKVPEVKRIDLKECQSNLVHHIWNLQNQLSFRLDWLEQQVSVLEKKSEEVPEEGNLEVMMHTLQKELLHVQHLAKAHTRKTQHPPRP